MRIGRRGFGVDSPAMSGVHQRSDVPPAGSDRRHLGLAWLALTFAFVIHLLDEAHRDFLAIYESTATEVQSQLPFLPWPTVGMWLAGVGLLVLALFAVTPLAFRGSRWMRWAAYAFAGLTAWNAGAHFIDWLRTFHATPGTWSSLLLLIAAAMLYVAARRATPGHHLPLAPLSRDLPRRNEARRRPPPAVTPRNQLQ